MRCCLRQAQDDITQKSGKVLNPYRFFAIVLLSKIT